MRSDKKKRNKTKKGRKKHGKRKYQNDENDFSENEIPNLNSLKSFEFEPKTNIGDINIVAVMMRKRCRI